MHKSAVSQDLLEYVLTLMISELGAEQIIASLRKLREADWAYEYKLFLELIALYQEKWIREGFAVIEIRKLYDFTAFV